MISADTSQSVVQPQQSSGVRFIRSNGWWLVCSLILVLSAWFMYPIAGGDSIFFMPVAWFYAHGQGLINPLVPLACATDPLHQCRYCFHLPLFPWLIGGLASIHPTVRTLFALVAGLSIAKLWVINREMTFPSGNRSKHWLFGGSMLLATYYSLPNSGRPEILSSLLIVLVFATVRKRVRAGLPGSGWLIPVLLGALLGCHFTGFYFTLLGVLIEMSLRTADWKRSLIDSLRLTLVAVLVGVLIVAVSPNGFDTLAGIVDHANRQLGGEDMMTLKNLFYWTTSNTINFLFGVFFLIAAGLYGQYVHRSIRRKAVGTERSAALAVVIPCLAAMVLGVLVFVVKKPNRVYDLTQFMGVLLIVLFQHVQTSRRVVRLAYGGMLALALVPFGRETVLFADYLADGKVYDAAKDEVHQLEVRSGAIAGTQVIWVLADDLNRFTFWEKGPSQSPVVIEQARRSLPAEVQQKGVLLRDWRTTDVRRVLGVPMSNHPQGYSFSVWQMPARP